MKAGIPAKAGNLTSLKIIRTGNTIVYDDTNKSKMDFNNHLTSQTIQLSSYSEEFGL